VEHGGFFYPAKNNQAGDFNGEKKCKGKKVKEHEPQGHGRQGAQGQEERLRVLLK
jgi:hypothetical protein